MLINYNETAEFLKENDNYIIFSHGNPDGDTIGSAFGLCFALRKLGKKANVRCCDEYSEKFRYIFEKYSDEEFSPEKYICVDVADPKLMGKEYCAEFSGKIDLCIDHHVSNLEYARRTLLKSNYPAAAQVVFELIYETSLVEFDEFIASCLYTGIVTDTGCFRFSSVLPSTHIAAAKLMEFGINSGKICREMMEKKNFKRIEIERRIHSKMEFFFDNKVAVGAIFQSYMDEIGIEKKELDGLAHLTTELDTVEVGILIREKEEGIYKASLRSTGDVNVCEICKKFEGGGHAKAGGCTINGTFLEAQTAILKAVGEYL